MGEERLILCRDNLPSRLSPAEKMWKDRDFTDVTLVSGDRVKIEAHRVIIASSSNFFRDILQQNLHPKPLIFMKEFHHVHLQMALELIYRGECEVSREDLEDFLERAKELEIEGIVERDCFEVDEEDEATFEEWDNAVELSENIPPQLFEESRTIDGESREVAQYLWSQPLLTLFNDKPMTVKKSSLQFNCDKCNYDSWNIFLLKNHKMVKHVDKTTHTWDHNDEHCKMCLGKNLS